MGHLTARRPAPGSPGDVTRARLHHVLAGELIRLDWQTALSELEIHGERLSAQVYLELWAAYLAESLEQISELVFTVLHETDPGIAEALMRGAARNPRVMAGV